MPSILPTRLRSIGWEEYKQDLSICDRSQLFTARLEGTSKENILTLKRGNILALTSLNDHSSLLLDNHMLVSLDTATKRPLPRTALDCTSDPHMLCTTLPLTYTRQREKRTHHESKLSKALMTFRPRPSQSYIHPPSHEPFM